ncbi:methyltransferase family protein [Leptolyngbya sp. PCC 6406]|uniref:methyltransferase family protein n=1 Tax=Leptolyngbya sp. PCC 6406 TaxID=1173264 RepID=UPI0002ACE89F|nr:isoprenylcysteine carboxylmethyltransferase family protein [Leptolyngbya sp. PCC 6406]
MGLWQDWGFSKASWKGERGEYWVLGQAVLLVGFGLVPLWQPAILDSLPIWTRLGTRAIAVGLALLALLLLGKGLVDLGPSLTPLPYPREDGELVQTGVYSLVRHCLYSGLILGTAAYSFWTLSLSHFMVTLALFVLLDAKARQEEIWLMARYPDYEDYRHRVKKLIPWLY